MGVDIGAVFDGKVLSTQVQYLDFTGIMNFTGINLLGLFAAFVFSSVSGAAWFNPKTFLNLWLKERGMNSASLKSSPHKPALLYSATAIGVLVQTLTLGLIINALAMGGAGIGILDGAVVGFMLGVGISMFSSLSHRLFSGESLKVWVIETSNDAINLTAAGAIIAFFN